MTSFEPVYPPDYDSDELSEMAEEYMDDLPDSHRMPPFNYPG